MGTVPRDHWLIGSKGVYHGTIGGSWTRIGAQEYGISSLIREPGRLVAGASWGSGLWEWPNDADQAGLVQPVRFGRPLEATARRDAYRDHGHRVD